MSSTTTPIKIKLNGTIRRGRIEDISWESFHALCIQLFGRWPYDRVVTYEDDEDVITLSSTPELCEAVLVAQEMHRVPFFTFSSPCTPAPFLFPETMEMDVFLQDWVSPQDAENARAGASICRSESSGKILEEICSGVPLRGSRDQMLQDIRRGMIVSRRCTPRERVMDDLRRGVVTPNTAREQVLQDIRRGVSNPSTPRERVMDDLRRGAVTPNAAREQVLQDIRCGVSNPSTPRERVMDLIRRSVPTPQRVSPHDRIMDELRRSAPLIEELARGGAVIQTGVAETFVPNDNDESEDYDLSYEDTGDDLEYESAEECTYMVNHDDVIVIPPRESQYLEGHQALCEMGFVDWDRNEGALSRYYGNVEHAVTWLLNAADQ